MPEVNLEQKIAERDRCRRDKLFLGTALGYDFQEDVHQELFDQYIQFDPSQPWAHQASVKKRLVLWPRGFYKTTSIVVEIIQMILNFPDSRILIMQGTKPVTQTLLHTILAHFTGDNSRSRFQELFPEFCGVKNTTTGQMEFGRHVMKATQEHFTTPARKNKGLAQATVTVASPRSQKTGQHFSAGFFDDLVNEANWRSEKLLERVREDYEMCMPLLDPPHFAYITGTRYAHGDLYEQLIRRNKGEWQVSVKNCWSDDGKSVRFSERITEDGRVIGFTREGLLQLRADDPAMFSSQYLNQPVAQGGQRFPRELMELALVDEKDTPPLGPAVFFIDLASTDGQKSDDSVIVVGKTDLQMKQYVVDCRGGKWPVPVLSHNIIELALRYRPVKIYVEKTAGSIYFIESLRYACRDRNIWLPIEFLKSDNKYDAKYIRIAAMESLIKTGRLCFLRGMEAWDKITTQFGIFPGGRSKHDDYPDTIGLMAREFSSATLAMPSPRQVKNPILAMMEQRERDLAHIVDDPPSDDGTEGFVAF